MNKRSVRYDLPFPFLLFPVLILPPAAVIKGRKRLKDAAMNEETRDLIEYVGGAAGGN